MSDAGSDSPAEEAHRRDDDEILEEIPEDAGNGSDKDSDLLSEIDEDQFEEDYDPTAEDKPQHIDENVARTLKAPKRKRTDTETVKKPKEGRRPKKRARADDDVDVGGSDHREHRVRKSRVDDEERRARKEAAEKAEEEKLTPEERKRREFDRAIDNAMKNPSKRRRKKDEIDLEEEIDEQIAVLKVAMEKACVADNDARAKGQPAIQKLKLLPKVTALLTRTAIQDSVLDPDTNFLQSVKYFLEPLSDGSLPAYNIQRDIFNALAKLPIGKDALLSSGIGKVILFYVKSKRPEAGIKRIAQRLMGEWSRPILKRTDDYKKRHIETRDFDFTAAKIAQQQEASLSGSQMTLTQRPAGKSQVDLERERLLAPAVSSNRARPAGLPASYSIAPKSTFNPSSQPDFKPIGASGLEAFRKLTQKGKKRG